MNKKNSIKKMISLLCAILLTVSTVFASLPGNVFASAETAPPTDFTELSWTDFSGLELKEYVKPSPDVTKGTIGTYSVSLNETLLNGNIILGAETDIRYAGQPSNPGWSGLVIRAQSNGTLLVNNSTFDTAYNVAYDPADYGLTSFAGVEFNLKISTEIEGNKYTFGIWVNNQMLGDYFTLTESEGGMGNIIGLYDTGNGKNITLLEAVSEEETIAPPTDFTELGWTDFSGLELKEYVKPSPDETKGTIGTYSASLNETLLNGNIILGAETDIRYAGQPSNPGWSGLVIRAQSNGTLLVNNSTFDTAYNVAYDPADYGLTSFAGVEFNLKISTEIEGNNYTFGIWVNDQILGDYFTLTESEGGMGNIIGLYDTGNGKNITLLKVVSEDGPLLPPEIPDIYNPPTTMGGETWAGKYITFVEVSEEGTTVISAADTDNGYKTTANYKNYNLDYVMDYNVNRDLKILQITDTQIIDAAQCRTEDRLNDNAKEIWASEEMYNNVFRYIIKTVNDSQPDLILLTGDIIYGEFDDNGTSLLALIDCMDSLKIPWAPIFGNHDNESNMGVDWQCEQLEASPYCLFTRRNEIGGNGNYSIGVAKNGSLEKVIYMMDSNGCSNNSDMNGTKVITSIGFTDNQKSWYKETATNVNTVAGKTISSFLCYHIPTKEVLEGAVEAGYQINPDSNDIKYTIGVENLAQPGDSGYKGEIFKDAHEEAGLLQIMKQVGTNGAFFGHSHLNNISVMYEGVRWTFGLKTGTYDRYPSIMGGTLITLATDSDEFTVIQIQMTEAEIAQEYAAQDYILPEAPEKPEAPKPAEPPTDFTELCWTDFAGLAYKEYIAPSPDVSQGTIGTYTASLNETLLNGNIILGAETDIRYAGQTSNPGWSGLVIRAQSDGTLLVNSSTFDTAYNKSYQPADYDLTSFVGVEFNLKISTEIEGNNYTFGIWVNDQILGNYFTLTESEGGAGNIIGLYDNGGGNNITLVGNAQEPIEPGKPQPPTESKSPDEGLKKLSFLSFGIEDAEYVEIDTTTFCASGTYYDTEKGKTLDGTLFHGKVKFGAKGGAQLRFGGLENAWCGLVFLGNADGTMTLTEAELNAPEKQFAYYFIPSEAGCQLVGEWLDLKISTQFVDCDNDGVTDDVKLGIWFNDVLYQNEYIFLCDYAPHMGAYMSVYSSNEEGYISIQSVEVDNKIELGLYGFDDNYLAYFRASQKDKVKGEPLGVTVEYDTVSYEVDAKKAVADDKKEEGNATVHQTKTLPFVIIAVAGAIFILVLVTVIFLFVKKRTEKNENYSNT